MKSFLVRRAAQLALTVNAVRPASGKWTSIPAFFAGWLTAELAPQLLALTAADTAVQLARSRARPAQSRTDRVGLALAGLCMAGLGTLIRSGQRARSEVDAALKEALGADYSDELDPAPTPEDLATPWRQLVVPFRMRNEQVICHSDIDYGTGGRRQRLDVYQHRDRPTGRPVLLEIHGGGWMIGQKDQQGIPLMLHMAERGWVCVSANYPLSPKARWPEHAVALKRAIAWIKDNIADYGGDPSFVAVTGGSAGGHLAALLALSGNDPDLQPGFEHADTSIQVCVPHYGPYDIAAQSGSTSARQLRDGFLAPLVMGKEFDGNQDVYHAASPLARISGDTVPFFVIHGRNDSLVPVREAREFVRRLRAVSTNPVAYAELAGAQHAFDIFPSIRSAHVVRGVERFLQWTYRNHRRHDQP